MLYSFCDMKGKEVHGEVQICISTDFYVLGNLRVAGISIHGDWNENERAYNWHMTVQGDTPKYSHPYGNRLVEAAIQTYLRSIGFGPCSVHWSEGGMQDDNHWDFDFCYE